MDPSGPAMALRDRGLGEERGQRRRGGGGLYEEDAFRNRNRAENARHHHANEREHEKGRSDLGVRRQKAVRQASRQKTVVEALVCRQDARLESKGRGRLEYLLAKGLGPKEHLQDEKSDVLERDDDRQEGGQHGALEGSASEEFFLGGVGDLGGLGGCPGSCYRHESASRKRVPRRR